MNNIEAVKELLSLEALQETWDDYYEDELVNKLEQLTKSDWDSLSNIWQEKTELWQTRLIGALGSIQTEHSIHLLENIALNSNPKLTMEVFHSLEGIEDEIIYVPSDKILKRIHEINSKELKQFEKDTIDSLLLRASSE